MTGAPLMRQQGSASKQQHGLPTHAALPQHATAVHFSLQSTSTLQAPHTGPTCTDTVHAATASCASPAKMRMSTQRYSLDSSSSVPRTGGYHWSVSAAEAACTDDTRSTVHTQPRQSLTTLGALQDGWLC